MRDVTRLPRNAVKAVHQLNVFGVGVGCTRSIAEEFGHGRGVIWTYLPPGPLNPALPLPPHALGTSLLDKHGAGGHGLRSDRLRRSDGSWTDVTSRSAPSSSPDTERQNGVA